MGHVSISRAVSMNLIGKVRSRASLSTKGIRSVPMTFELGRCDFQRKIQMLLLKGERMYTRQAKIADIQFFNVFIVNISIIIY